MTAAPDEFAEPPRLQTEWWTPRLAGPVIAAAVVRLGLLAVALFRAGTGGLFLADTSSYTEVGRNLLQHGRFVADGVPDLVRTPGYPLFFAITSLAGLPATAVASVLLSVFSVFLVWKLGRAVFDDDRIALIAAWIFAFEPSSVALSDLLLSDTLFLAIFLFSMERLAEFLRRRRLGVLAVAGLLLAAATFVRPVTYYLPVALAIGLYVVLARVPGLRWKAPAVLLISVLPWLAAWQIRNRVETGYSGFSSISEVNLYFHVTVNLLERVEHRHDDAQLGYSSFCNCHNGQSYLYEPYVKQHPEQAGWNQAQRLAFMHSEATRVIREHFGTYLLYCLQPLIKTLAGPGTMYLDHQLAFYPEQYARTTGLLDDAGLLRWAILLAKAEPWELAEKAAFTVVLMGLYLLAARGLFLAARGVFRGSMHSACLGMMLGISLYFLVISAAAGGLGADARYRLPVMPIVCILAAAGARRTTTIVRSRCAGIAGKISPGRCSDAVPQGRTA
jgi:hypothetical protein